MELGKAIDGASPQHALVSVASTRLARIIRLAPTHDHDCCEIAGTKLGPRAMVGQRSRLASANIRRKTGWRASITEEERHK